jgi:hypothetical protein
MSDMSTASLSVVYDGPALEAGAMDVRELAPALLALGKLLEESNRIVNGDKSTLSVHVKAGFKAGSFQIDLDLAQTFLNQVRDLFSGSSATAIANVLGFLGFSGVSAPGLFALIKRGRGRKPKNAIILADGNVQIEFGVSDVIVVPRQTLDLYLDAKVRTAALNAIKPLAQQGIDTFAVRPAGVAKETPAELVQKDDLPSFELPEFEEQLIPTQEHRASFSIMSLSFQDDNKWRLFDGQNAVWARIEDEAFLGKVDKNEISFAKGDILICDVINQQWQTAAGLRTETRILHVIEHRSAARQLGLSL